MSNLLSFNDSDVVQIRANLFWIKIAMYRKRSCTGEWFPFNMDFSPLMCKDSKKAPSCVFHNVQFPSVE